MATISSAWAVSVDRSVEASIQFPRVVDRLLDGAELGLQGGEDRLRAVVGAEDRHDAAILDLNRPDLVADANTEMAILEAYLPQQLTPEELDALAQEAVDETGATSMREMGQVMKVLMPRLEGRATGQEASQAVRKLLN